MLCSTRAGRAPRPYAAFIRLAKHRAHGKGTLRNHQFSRCFATEATIPKQESIAAASASLARPSTARFNEIGVQQLSDYVYSQIFEETAAEPPPPELVELSKDHLQRHKLLGKNTDTTNPIAFDLPPLQGVTLDEHFYKLGTNAAEPYLTYAKKFVLASPPPKPLQWEHKSGWVKYNRNGTTEEIEEPDEEMLCFDTEVMWKESSFAVMACAVSPDAWYAWISPWLLGLSDTDRHLIPMGDPAKPRIIVGHNIGYDRARIKEEYDFRQSKNAFLDTMSLHVAVNGMCSRQRPTWMKHKKNRELRDKIACETDNAELATLLGNRGLMEEEEELWVGRSSINSLRDVAKFHLDVTIDKAQRNSFGELDRAGILEQLDPLLTYCAADVVVTHRVYSVVFENFLRVCPHPVSFAALRHLSSVILPVDKSWEAYIKNAETKYLTLRDAVQDRLIALTEKALALKDNEENWRDDPWLSQLDWSGQQLKMKKGKKKGDPMQPAAKQGKKPGMPKWYKDLFPKVDSPISISVRTRIAPIMLRLSWDSHPLVWSDKYAWTFQVPLEQAQKYIDMQMQQCKAFEEEDMKLRDDTTHIYFKLPHKDGPTARCGNPMAKSYMTYFEKGILSSEFEYAKEALEMNASCSYWISARDRIKSQMVVYGDDGAIVPESSSDVETGYILPQIIPMGTVTRRAVENTWLTASNAKKNRVGSELKSMVRAPPGFVFVGADVDSEELWIASLVGDAQFKLHGGNAIGFMTLEGTKAAGTDLHSRTAGILGITRNDAKVFNYGRIYGAGLKFASTLLRQFNPGLSETETTKVATNLYKETKGTKTTRKSIYPKPFWRGGTESFVFNKLEEFAEQERPRTPVLGAGITEALMSRFINKGGFMTSRINWAIQSSGVDYLHLLIISMDYLIRRFNLNARLAITVHDEIRYLVADEHKYKTAMALQVANIWTRAMFSQQMGINDLPQSCAFFSAVDIDHVLRKEVDMDCITPSHPNAIPHGESLDINALLEKGDESALDPATIPRDPLDVAEIPYTPRAAVMDGFPTYELSFLKAQITADDAELRDLLRDARKVIPPKVMLKPKSKFERSVLPYESTPQLMEEPMNVGQLLGTGKFGERRDLKKTLSWQKSPVARKAVNSRPW